MFLTIVIPAYNCEDTIQRLMDSIRQQDTDDFKVIICDDSDHEGLHEYIRPYEQDFQIDYYMREPEPYTIHCPGDTRHSGLLRALQEDTQYITFIDCDDKFVPNSFGTLIELLQTEWPDIAASRFDVLDDEDRFQYKEQISLGWLHGKVYRAEFLRKYGINFKPNMATHEDTYFNSVTAYYAVAGQHKTMETNDFEFYIWYRREKSFTHINASDTEIYIQKYFRDYIYASTGINIELYMKYGDMKYGVEDKTIKKWLIMKTAHSIYTAYCYFQGFCNKGKRERVTDAYEAMRDAVWDYMITFGVSKQDLIKIMYSEPQAAIGHRQASYVAVGQYIETESFKDFINNMRFW